MGTIWIKELTGGLDARRLPETTPGGVLIRATDGHITRGGEFEKRAAFVPAYALPVGTVGLASTKSSLVVFGSGASPVLPTGVAYQQLIHPLDSGLELTDVLSYDLYDGKLYVVARFADGSVYHYYDGTAVTDWFDGRARAGFRVVGGAVSAGAVASGTFTVTGGSSGSGNEITSIQISGVNLIAAPVAHTGSNSTTAAAIASAINSHTSTPDYTASALGAVVTVTAVTVGTAVNGQTINVTVGGDVTVGSGTAMAGGAAPTTSRLNDLRVDGVAIISAPVLWATSNEATATAIAAAINSFTSTPDYIATAVGDAVNIIAAAQGADANGKAVAFTLANGLQVSPVTDLVMAEGGTFGGTKARGSFTITGGSSGTLLPSINGVNLTATPIAFNTDIATTASAIAAAINAHTSTPDYTATSLGAVVTVTTAANTSALNGEDIDVAVTGTMSVLDAGVRATASFEPDILRLGGAPTLRVLVSGVEIMAAPVGGASSNAIAANVTAAINSFTSTPDYTATASGRRVTLRAETPAAAINGVAPTFVIENAYFLAVENVVAFSGGVDPKPVRTAMAGGTDDDAFVPGSFVKTVGSKMYSVAGSNLHFSGIAEPTKWTSDATGAGFINMASENSGSETLKAVARYQNLLAVFSDEVIQTWYIDPNPDLNRQVQVLSNTGTDSPRSVTQFGDNDIFYLDESGVRSLRARDSSNAAATTDIGVPIDDLIVAKMAELSEDDRRKVIGLINPIDKRFWLILKDTIFVFSFFANAKVSAWTTYGTAVTTASDDYGFEVDEAAIFNRRIYLRADRKIFVYGGTGGDLAYDHTEAEAWLPYLDANRPSAKKDWEGLDIAVTGQWEVEAAMEPTDLTVSEVVARVTKTSYNQQRIPFNHSSSHVSLRFRSQGAGEAILSSAVVHYKGYEDED